jgi:hypothetical protein
LKEHSKSKTGIMKKRTSKKNDDLRIYTLEEAKDKLIGKRGTAKRDEYELDLSMDVLSDTIKRFAWSAI